MVGLTIAQKHDKTRDLILDILRRHKNMSARQISYELSEHGIWLSSVEIANFMRSDERLKKAVEVEFVRRGKWAGLIYAHVRNGSWGSRA